MYKLYSFITVFAHVLFIFGEIKISTKLLVVCN